MNNNPDGDNLGEMGRLPDWVIIVLLAVIAFIVAGVVSAPSPLKFLNLLFPFELFSSESPSAYLQPFGLMGDYIGGVLGTVLLILTVYFSYKTFLDSRQGAIDAKRHNEELYERHRKDLTLRILSLNMENARNKESLVDDIDMAMFDIKCIFSEISSILHQYYSENNINLSREDKIKVFMNFVFHFMVLGISIFNIGVEKSDSRGRFIDAANKFHNHDYEIIKKICTGVHQKLTAENRGESRPPHKLGKYVGFIESNLWSYFSTIDRENFGKSHASALCEMMTGLYSEQEKGIIALMLITCLGDRWREMQLIKKYQPFSGLRYGFFKINLEIDVHGNAGVGINERLYG